MCDLQFFTLPPLLQNKSNTCIPSSLADCSLMFPWFFVYSPTSQGFSYRLPTKSSLCLGYQLPRAFLRNLLVKSSKDEGRWSSDFHSFSSPQNLLPVSIQALYQTTCGSLSSLIAPILKGQKDPGWHPCFPPSCILSQLFTS